MRVARLCRVVLAALAGLAVAASAEPLSTAVAIPDGDRDAARADAVRALLWEAGLRGQAEVRSQSALIGGELRETTLVQARFRLRKFRILSEDVVDGRLQLTADIEREEADEAACTASLPLHNIAYVWAGNAGGPASAADVQAGAALGAALGDALRVRAGPYLQDNDAGRAEALYRIVASLAPPPRGGESGTLSLQLRATPEDRLIKEIRLPTGRAPLARQEDANLGYALLRQWVTSPAGRQLAAEAARQLDDALRCLPALLRIPPLEADGGFSLVTRFPLPLNPQGLVLYFPVWPVREGGAVDLLQADGYLQPQPMGPQHVRFTGSAPRPGRKSPVSGGYLLLL